MLNTICYHALIQMRFDSYNIISHSDDYFQQIVAQKTAAIYL